MPGMIFHTQYVESVLSITIRKCCNRKGLSVYSLDLATLLMMLEGIQHTGQLQATMPAGTPQVSAGRAVITVTRGRITGCVIFNQRGQIVMSGERALLLIKHLGPLGWRLIQNTANQTNTALQLEMSPEQRSHQPQQINLAQQAYFPQPQQTSPLQRLDLPHPVNTNTTQANTVQRSNPDWPTQPAQLSPHVTRPIPRVSGLQPNVTTPLPRVTGPIPRAPRLQPQPEPRTPIPNTPSLSQQGSPLMAALTPQRKTTIDGQTLTNLPRRLRRVLVLVDGQRSIGKIADLLYTNQDRFSEVLDALRELEGMRIITLTRS
jgi:hypothetical protein